MMIGRALLLFLAAVVLTAFFVPRADAQSYPCFDIEIAENNLRQNFDERVIGVGVTFTGDLMKLFVSPGGKWTIGVVPAGREGMLCPLQHGDGFSTEKNPGTKPGLSLKPMSASLGRESMIPNSSTAP